MRPGPCLRLAGPARPHVRLRTGRPVSQYAYKQAAELGGQVRKGEKGSLVVYADKITKAGTDHKGAAVEIEIPFMKGYTVFNAEQVDGLPGHFYATVLPLNKEINRLDTVEAFFATTKATIQHGGRAVGDERASRNRKFESTPLQRRVVQTSFCLTDPSSLPLRGMAATGTSATRNLRP
jgi:hypothetical protein